MSHFQPTDEEILSYLIGDCSPEFSKRIKEELQTNSSLRDQVEFVALLRGEIKHSPLQVRPLASHRPVWLLKQVALVAAVFLIGVLAESNFGFLAKEKVTINSSSKTSTPLSWDDSPTHSLM